MLLVCIVFVEQGQRRIPVQFASGWSAGGCTAESTYIPLKVNQSGVIPIIFASSVLTRRCDQQVLPPTPAAGASASGGRDDPASPTPSPLYLLIYGLLIIGFAYFYTASPSTRPAGGHHPQAGGFIPGIRPGRRPRSTSPTSCGSSPAGRPVHRLGGAAAPRSS